MSIDKLKYAAGQTVSIPQEDYKAFKLLLDETESTIADWLKKDEWKHYKSIVDSKYPIVVDSISDKDSKADAFRVTATIPESDPKRARDYFTRPHFRAEFDTEMMELFHSFPIQTCDSDDISATESDESDDSDGKEAVESDDSGNSDEKCTVDSDDNDDSGDVIGISVVRLKPITMGGWEMVSPRLYVTLGRDQWCDGTKEYCHIATYLRENALNRYTSGINVSVGETMGLESSDLDRYVGGRNIRGYFGASKSDTVENATRVTYILQCDNGGWIPQKVNEYGLVDQHLIKMMSQMTKWLLNP